jgi:autotransporter-associated beta strand protein
MRLRAVRGRGPTCGAVRGFSSSPMAVCAIFGPLVAVMGAASVSRGDPVLENGWDNGFFAPFNAGNAATVKYGDSGWLGGPDALPISLERIDMGLVGFDSPTAGTTDIVVTFNNGDPSGLVFGNGAELYRTTFTGVTLPATEPGEAVGFTLSVPLPGVATTGGFNNVGWSVSLANYDYAGRFGFQVSTFSNFTTGFPTNNASFFNGSSWSLFSFGPDPETQSANFVATVVAVPEPIVFDVPFGVIPQGTFGRPVVNSAESVTKTGAGTLQFDALNRYLGPTLIAEGTLALVYDQSGSVIGSIENSPAIIVAEGATFDVTAPTFFTELQAFFLDDGQTLGGAGTVAGSVILGGGSTLAPGMPAFAGGPPGTVSSVPEPSAWWLAAAGLAGGLARRLRRRAP